MPKSSAKSQILDFLVTQTKKEIELVEGKNFKIITSASFENIPLL